MQLTATSNNFQIHKFNLGISKKTSVIRYTSKQEFQSFTTGITLMYYKTLNMTQKYGKHQQTNKTNNCVVPITIQMIR